jgi:hypothetical protein
MRTTVRRLKLPGGKTGFVGLTAFRELAKPAILRSLHSRPHTLRCFSQATVSMSNEQNADESSDNAVESPPEDTIALDRFLKLANVVQSGGAAKHLIQSGVV